MLQALILFLEFKLPYYCFKYINLSVYKSFQIAKRGPMDMHMKRQTFSDLNGSDSDESDVGSSEVLAVQRS